MTRPTSQRKITPPPTTTAQPTASHFERHFDSGECRGNQSEGRCGPCQNGDPERSIVSAWGASADWSSQLNDGQRDRQQDESEGHEVPRSHASRHRQSGFELTHHRPPCSRSAHPGGHNPRLRKRQLAGTFEPRVALTGRVA
jgi:hypothetical protein